MIRLFIFSILVSLLVSRDDPFVPNIEPDSVKRPYYGIDYSFNNATITLPSSARLVKKVDITYQNIDGSIETKSVSLSGRVDWRMPLILSHGSARKKDSNKQNVIKGNGYTINDNSIHIFYNGSLRRHFPMVNPDRIVLDFDINMAFYKKNTINLNTKYFSNIKYGLHDNFIRVVLYTNGKYIYSAIKHKDGITISVK